MRDDQAGAQADRLRRGSASSACGDHSHALAALLPEAPMYRAAVLTEDHVPAALGNYRALTIHVLADQCQRVRPAGL